jgi:hypothetical protein
LDKNNIGNYSFAAGYGSTASGIFSVSMGTSTASNTYSVALGYSNTASGIYAVGIGSSVTASGFNAVALGHFNSATGDYSTTMGRYTAAAGLNSTAIGYETLASGNISTSMGQYTIAKAMHSIAMGTSNDITDSPNPSEASPSDRIFQLGNGTFSTRSNAITVLRNGRTGIGTTTPLARFHVADSSVLFSSAGFPAGPGNPPPIQGPGRRMMWYVDRAAFRVGAVDGVLWDHDSIGNFSFAAGYNTKAKGVGSVSLGANNKASGVASFSAGENNTSLGSVAVTIGEANTAAGSYSVAIGFSNAATGPFSTAIGNTTFSSGYTSLSAGFNTKAKSDYTFVTGLYNDTTAVNSLFEIGNGTGLTNRSNAFTVTRNGDVGIGTVNPGTRLHIVQGASGFAGGYFQGMALEGNANTYFNLLSPNSSETGILFGKASNAAHGGIIYNNAGHPNGMEFRTNGNLTKMVLLDNGRLGVGVLDPTFLFDVGDRMRIRAGAGGSAGLWLNNDINTTSPAFIGMFANDEVGFYGQTGTAGWRFYINTTTGNGWMQGTLTQNSDMRLKKDIAPLQNSLQKIMKLGGYHYFWKNGQGDDRLQTGVLAQEVQKMFPELVSENKDGILAVNYSGLIPVLIESIKEQQKQIDELKKLVQQLLNK